MTIFEYDVSTTSIKISEYTILLIKEFKDLWSPERNKTKGDPKGEKRIKAYKEFTYLYLATDFKSPYWNYLEEDKHNKALIDSELTEKEFNDPLFQAALKKYREIIDSDRILSLIKTTNGVLWKTQVYLESVDFSDVDENGKPIVSPKQVMENLPMIAKMRDHLQELEVKHKQGLAEKEKIRGDNSPGMMDISPIKL